MAQPSKTLLEEIMAKLGDIEAVLETIQENTAPEGEPEV
jgi:hypothetical protein